MKSTILWFYVVTTVACIGGCMWILDYGSGLQAASRAAPVESSSANLFEGLVANAHHPVGTLLMQLILVIAAAKVLGALFQRFGQPAVIGEMLAGIILGPSLLVGAFPEFGNLVFPPQSLGSLHLLAQLGVILFMFFVGLELDLPAMRKRARAALLVSHTSIVAPFLLGCALALVLYSSLAPEGVGFVPFSLFMGIAMSITAFPVLARILRERGMINTPLGAIAIACAAVDDVTAWCILALVIAITKANGMGGAVMTVLLAVLFIAVMVLLVRPRVAAFAERDLGDERSSGGRVVLALVFICAAALCTEIIGIHALFGAFLAGAIMSGSSRLGLLLRERVETFSAAFLLPLFFAFTGLRTEIGLLATVEDWLVCSGIIAVAIAGKFGGTLLASRVAGLNWHDSLTLGTLMNTRGLMELIVLNIGYDLGILSPRIFAMMVVMALVTTMMTGPVLSFLEWRRARATQQAVGVASG